VPSKKYIYIHIYIHIFIYMYVYIYTYVLEISKVISLCPPMSTISKLNLCRYCTRLGQAQTEEDKTAVLEDMRNTPDAQAVLEA